MIVEIKRLNRNLPLPEYQSFGAAGFDLYCSEFTIVGNSPIIVPTGIAIAVEEGYEAQIRPRSGLSAKHGLTVVNSPGTIDSDYRGEIKVIMQVLVAGETVTLNEGDRIAQMVIKPAPQAEIIEVDFLDETVRGANGFGSTGK